MKVAARRPGSRSGRTYGRHRASGEPTGTRCWPGSRTLDAAGVREAGPRRLERRHQQGRRLGRPRRRDRAGARPHDPKVVVEQAVAGREIECGVLEGLDGGRRGEPLPAEIRVHRRPRLLRLRGEVPRRRDRARRARRPPDDGRSERLRGLAVRAFDALGCEGLARVDFFLTDDGALVVNEVNTMPGFTPVSMFPRMWAATGVDYPALVDRAGQRRRCAERPACADAVGRSGTVAARRGAAEVDEHVDLGRVRRRARRPRRRRPGRSSNRYAVGELDWAASRRRRPRRLSRRRVQLGGRGTPQRSVTDGSPQAAVYGDSGSVGRSSRPCDGLGQRLDEGGAGLDRCRRRLGRRDGDAFEQPRAGVTRAQDAAAAAPSRRRGDGDGSGRAVPRARVGETGSEVDDGAGERAGDARRRPAPSRRRACRARRRRRPRRAR